MSVMAEKTASPEAAAQPTTQVQANWQYSMNMYNMYQNAYMYGQAYQAQNYYQYYGQRLPTNWNEYAAGAQMAGWPQMPVTPMVSQGDSQQQATSTSSQEPMDVDAKSNLTSNNLQAGSADLPPLPPGPPPPSSVPATTSETNTRPQQSYRGSAHVATPIRFNMSAQKARSSLPQNNALNSSQPLSKKQKKKQRKRQLMLAKQQQAMEEEEEEEEEGGSQEMPPLPASPPPLPPPPPPVAAPPLPPPSYNTNQQTDNPNVQNPPGMKGVNDWPPSLREYVNKCYSKCVTKIDFDRVGVILKGKIMRATNDGALWSKDWSEEPLPLLDSDAKPTLNLGLNLKDKLKVAARLGPFNKIQEPKNQSQNQPSHRRSYRPSFKRNYSSDSSSSSSSDSEDDSPKRRDNKKSSWSNNKRHSNKKSERSERHLYKEYGAIGGGAGAPVKKEILDKRAARFSSNSNTNRPKSNVAPSPVYFLDSKPNSAYVPKTAWSSVEGPKGDDDSLFGNQDWEEDLHIVGTSTDIEKPYLRLTSAPDASQVRPPQILAKSLSMVKEKWAREGDYHYTCEQLKSIRQDLTVQGLRDDFTISVYETHARIALEKGDHAEFNQCQAQLAQLHSSNSKNKGEFIAYRILYYIFTNEFLDLSTLIQKLSKEEKEDECTKHALQMARHWVSGVHSRFFKLYRSAPRMGSYLLDLFIHRERLKALKVIVKAYRPAVPVDLVMKELAFASIGDTLEFIEKFGLLFTDDSKTKIDCKSSTPILAAV